MPSDSASESKIPAESAEIEEIGDRSGRLQDAVCLEMREGEIEVDVPDVKVSAEIVEDRNSEGVDIKGGSESLEKDATSSENLQDVEKLESKGGSVEEIGDQTSGLGEIGVGSEIVEKDVNFIERRRSGNLQDEHKLGEEVEIMAVRSEAKIGEEFVVESYSGKETVDGQQGFVQFGVVEIHSGSGVVEKVVSCLEKSEGTMNDEIASLESDDQEQVEIAVVETAVGQEDKVSQSPEPQVMNHDCDHKESISQNENIREEVSVASESVTVDDSVKLEEADVIKEPNPVDPHEEEQMNELGNGSMMHGDPETSFSHASLVGTDQKICEIKLSDETAHNSLDGPALAAEFSDQGQEEVGVGSSAGQENIGACEHKSLEINQAPEHEVVDSEGEMGDGSVMRHGCDLKDSTSKKILAGGNQRSHEAGNAILDFVAVDDSAKLTEAGVEKDSNADDPVEEANIQLAESVNEDTHISCNDQEEAMVSRASSMDIDQNFSDEDKEAEAQVPVVDAHQKFQEEDNCSLESVPVDDINCHQVRGSAEMDMDTVIDGNRGKELEAYVLEESDSILNLVPVDSMVPQEHRVENGPNPDVYIVEEHADLMNEQTQAENAIVSLVCDNHQGNDPEASAPETSFKKTNQSFQEKSESILGPVLVDSVANQADSVVENPNFTEPAAEADVEDESVMEGSEGNEHKASSSEMFLVETNQKLQGNQGTTLGSVPVDNTMNEQASHVEAPNLADPVIESQPQIGLNESVAGNVEAPNIADPVVESQPQTVLNEAAAGPVDASKLADPFVELQTQVVLKEAVVGDGSLLHADKEMDFRTSVLQVPFMDHQETGNEAFASKTSLDVGAQNIHEDHVLEAPNLADHDLEIPPLSVQVTEAPNFADHVIEAPPSSDQVTGASSLPDHVTETPTLVDQVMDAVYLADVVLEPQPQLALNEAAVGDKSPLDVGKETDNNTSVSRTSFMENQETNNESSAAKSSLIDINQNIPKENDSIFGSVLAGCPTDHQSDNVGEFSIAADTVVGIQPQLSGGETGVSDNSMKNVDQGNDQEASDLPMSLVDTNENIQQENSVLDLVILNGTPNLEADTVTEGLIPSNSIEEQSHVIGAETKVDGSIMDLDQRGNHEGSQLNISLVDHTIGHPRDHFAKYLNPSNVVAESIEEADEKQEILGSVDGGDGTVDGSTDGELKAQGGEEKSMKKTKKKVIQSVAAICDQHVSYHLILEKANFSFSDLVWGKVKSHPWWPGQIFDLSDASKLAMKYQKKDSFLVAYYGDKTFAWCDESQLKPFHLYFAQMEKLCCSDTFVKAIRDILVEVSRRVDLGMACSCLPEEVYTDIKHQKVENAGIRGGIINSTIDRPTIANYFQPDKLLQYVETLAQFPNGKVDSLEFLIAKSQLKAFYRSKGYRELPVFTFTGGVMESVVENMPCSAKEPEEDKHCTPTPTKGESSISKGEHVSKDDVKRKNISKRSEDRVAVHIVNGGESKSVTKATEKSILSSSSKKHIMVESDPVDSGRCKKRMLDSFDDMELKSPSPTMSSSFKIGEFIRRAASQLTGVPTILKCQGETLKKHDVTGFDDLTGSPVENQKINLSFTEDYNSTDEMFSQLCLAAKDPMNEYNFVSPMVAFFREFRDFCVSSFSRDKEHVEKRRRGRPKKVISQQASSDISLSEDEKHAEKRKRVMQMKNIISPLASSDASSEDEKQDEKPVEKRKRGRPRKNPKPASSDSPEDKKPIQKLQRDIPNKVYSQLAPNEKRKRGRPRKVHADSVLSNTSKPDHTKDSYWSDMDLQKERNNKNQILKQYKRTSTGEQTLPHPSTPTSYIKQQLQLITMNPNMKHTFVAERSIVSVDEKIVDECMPTALILSFNNENSIPSEMDLIRIFSRYGPLKEADTYVLRKSNRAKVIFKRRVDAETAFSSAGKYSIFGPGLLSYQLKSWTPKSVLQATPQGTQDVAPVATPQKNHDAVPIATAQGNKDAAFIVAPQDIYGSVPITAALDDHEIAPITMAEDNHYAVSIITQNKCNAELTIGSNLKLSEQEEAVLASDPMEVEAEGIKSSPQGKHDAEHQDEEPSISPLDEHDLTPNFTQDNLNAASITLQGRCIEEPNKRINVDFSEAMISLDTVEVETEGQEPSPQDKHDPSLMVTPQQNQDETPVALPKKNHDAALLVTLHEKYEGPAVGSSLEISEQAEDAMEIGAEGKESSPQGKHVHDNQDVELVTSLLDQHNLTPAIVQDNLDAASISTLKEKCDEEPIAGSHLEISEQAVSDLMEVEAEDKESLPQYEVDQDKEDDKPVAPPLDEHDITPTVGQDNLHPPSIIPLLDKCNAGPIVGTSLELLDQNEALEVEAECKKLLRHVRHNLENEDKELVTSPRGEHDLTSTTTRDNIEALPIIKPRDTCDALLAEGSDLEVSEQAKSGMTIETMQSKAGGNNLEVSEQGEPSTASDTMQVEGKESS